MPKRSTFTTEQKRRIWKATQDFERSTSDRPRETIGQPESPIFFRNDSAQTIPPFGVMQMIDTMDVTNSYNLILVKRPIDSTLLRCPLLINSEREVLTNEYGTAQQGPVYRILHDGAHTYSPGDRLGSLTAAFTATYGSLYAVLGDDDIATNVVKCMFDTSCMYGKTKAAALMVGTPGYVYAYDAAGTLTSKEYVAETLVSDIPGATRIMMFSVYGRWFASEIC